ncbi:MAG: hypothetical protein QOK36_3771 [Gaiellales bacterium]|nr:hypothetical protein [Gaiellales bacterium]
MEFVSPTVPITVGRLAGFFGFAAGGVTVACVVEGGAVACDVVRCVPELILSEVKPSVPDVVALALPPRLLNWSAAVSVLPTAVGTLMLTGTDAGTWAAGCVGAALAGNGTTWVPRESVNGPRASSPATLTPASAPTGIHARFIPLSPSSTLHLPGTNPSLGLLPLFGMRAPILEGWRTHWRESALAFKLRLQIFFVILTVLPLLVGGWMIQRTVIETHASSIDQRLAVGVGTLGAQYSAVLNSASTALNGLANNSELQRAIVGGRKGSVRRLTALTSTGGLLITIADGRNRLMTQKPTPGAIPIKSIRIGKPEAIAIVRAYADVNYLITQSQRAYPDVLLGLANGTALQLGEQQLALPSKLVLGKPFRLRLSGAAYRAAVSRINDSQVVVALYPQRKLDAYARDVRLRVALLMGLLLLLIGAGAALVVRSLTHTLRSFADGIRAVASGRFDQRLPVHGGDEFSQFGETFNDMSSQLEQRIEELDSERRRVQEFGQRFGAALAATHDVATLLEIVVDSAVQLARAEGARLLVADEGTDVLVEQLRRGELGLAAGLLDAPVRYGEGIEGRALQTRQAVIGDEPVPLLAAPLVAEERVLGLLTLVGSADRPFGRDDAERVGSLVGQGAVAIENARLHRLIQKQAKTDPLTQLLNRREFEEQLAREVERAQRFGTPVGLVVLDLDDFKLINDRFGHLAGDGVLKAAAGAIRQCTREIDQPARWGGEEFAVILPHTGIDGAARLAERLRQAIAERQIPTPDGRSVRVTASFGVAALPGSGTTQVELTAAADDAVYRSKRAGKNRVSLADPQEGDDLSVPASYH